MGLIKMAIQNDTFVVSSNEATTHAGHQHGGWGGLVENLLEGLPIPHQLSEFLQHLIVDAIQVVFLLVVIMWVIYFLTGFVNMERLHKKLSSLKSIGGFLLAVCIGVLTPFCSCSVIPVLIGFLSVGVPVSVCLCYLTAASMLNITSIMPLFATAGWEFAVWYIVCAVIIIAGVSMLFSLPSFQKLVKVREYHGHDHHPHDGCETIWGRVKNALKDTWSVLKKCILWIILGVALSSWIMAYFSIDSLRQLVEANSLLAAISAVLIGIPIHSDIFSLSAILTLFLKISPGLALTFCVSAMSISLPSVIILTRAIKVKAVLLYCGIITGICLLLGIMLSL